jgi:hypothetical protein
VGNGASQGLRAPLGRARFERVIACAMHPVALVAVGVLIVNDWWLKPRFASWWTGKLSDVAGLVFAPLYLAAAIGAVRWLVRRDGALTRGRLAACVIATGAVFATVKLVPAAAHALAAALSLLGRHAAIVADPTDLAALPALGLAWWIGRRELRTVP